MDVIKDNGDVVETEGLRATFLRGRAVEIFGGAEEPVEADDAEVDDVGVEAPKGVMVDIKGLVEASEDGEVDRVGSGGRPIFVAEAFEEISE